MPRGKADAVATDVVLDEPIEAPLAEGDRVGTLTVKLGEDTVYDGPVVALTPVDSAGFFGRLWDTLLMWVFKLFRA